MYHDSVFYQVEFLHESVDVRFAGIETTRIVVSFQTQIRLVDSVSNVGTHSLVSRTSRSSRTSQTSRASSASSRANADAILEIEAASLKRLL